MWVPSSREPGLSFLALQTSTSLQAQPYIECSCEALGDYAAAIPTKYGWTIPGPVSCGFVVVCVKLYFDKERAWLTMVWSIHTAGDGTGSAAAHSVLFAPATFHTGPRYPVHHYLHL